jgi:hypothetical protein
LPQLPQFCVVVVSEQLAPVGFAQPDAKSTTAKQAASAQAMDDDKKVLVTVMFRLLRLGGVPSYWISGRILQQARQQFPQKS